MFVDHSILAFDEQRFTAGASNIRVIRFNLYSAGVERQPRQFCIQFVLPDQWTSIAPVQDKNILRVFVIFTVLRYSRKYNIERPDFDLSR